MRLSPETYKRVPAWIRAWWPPGMRVDWSDIDLGRGMRLIVLYRSDGARFEIKYAGGWFRATCFDGKGDVMRYVPHRLGKEVV